MQQSRAATLIGIGAILLWSTLASLTALRGPIPPFETTAIVFAVGGSTITAIAVLRGRAASLVPTWASFALGIYGLFIYHTLYFGALTLAPPAEASLITSLWALLTVLFSGLLPNHRLRAAHVIGALLGFAAAAILRATSSGRASISHRRTARLRAGLRLRVRLVELFAGLAAAGLRAQRKQATCLVTALLAGVCSLALGVPPPHSRRS